MLHYSDAIERVPLDLERFKEEYEELDETSDLLNLLRKRDRPYVEAVLSYIESQGSSGQIAERTVSRKNPRTPLLIRAIPNQNKNLIKILSNSNEIYAASKELESHPFFQIEEKVTPTAHRFYLTRKNDVLFDTRWTRPRTIVLSLHHKDYK